MLTLTHASLATISQLFTYKATGWELPPFPGYTADQWGIKAHNRPWIDEAGRFAPGQRVAEVGGAYSRLPEYLGEKYGLEPWVIDDFGLDSDEPLWNRWSDPRDWAERHPAVRYVFRRMGGRPVEIPDHHFDRIFSVSTLEHIPSVERLKVLQDMHRCLAPGGLQLHTIDVPVPRTKVLAAQWVTGHLRPLRALDRRLRHDIHAWFAVLQASGVRVAVSAPSLLDLLGRETLVESPDVVYRFYPPVDSPKPYEPGASMLIVIEDLPG